MTTETAKMPEYTKEQEAGALAKVAKYINPGNPGRWLDDEDIGIVLAMAKRTAEAEREAAVLSADCHDATCMACTKCCDTLAAERDALKARVAELETRVEKLSALLRIAEPILESDDWDGLAAQVREVLATVPPKPTPAPPVVVTREMVEAMLADAFSRASWSGARPVNEMHPQNHAARLVVALRKVLEVKP